MTISAGNRPLKSNETVSSIRDRNDNGDVPRSIKFHTTGDEHNFQNIHVVYQRSFCTSYPFDDDQTDSKKIFQTMPVKRHTISRRKK
jgi:hypothetical protein